MKRYGASNKEILQYALYSLVNFNAGNSLRALRNVWRLIAKQHGFWLKVVALELTIVTLLIGFVVWKSVSQ